MTAGSPSQCESQCINATQFICRSFAYDPLTKTCSLSHHNRRSIPQASLARMPSASYFEISTCFDGEFHQLDPSDHHYHSEIWARQLTLDLSLIFLVTTVSVNCESDYMIANVQSSTIFGGKLYTRERPTACFVDVGYSMDFSLPILLNGNECGTKAEVRIPHVSLYPTGWKGFLFAWHWRINESHVPPQQLTKHYHYIQTYTHAHAGRGRLLQCNCDTIKWPRGHDSWQGGGCQVFLWRGDKARRDTHLHEVSPSIYPFIHISLIHLLANFGRQTSWLLALIFCQNFSPRSINPHTSTHMCIIILAASFL